jgi:phosphatidylglycerophosphate synthase
VITGTGGIPTDRRPLRARDAGIWIPTAYFLVQRNITPNAVSIIGLAAGIIAGLLFASTSFFEPGILLRMIWLLAVAAVLFRGACNILDGVMAVETGMSTPVGLLWNEVPDRISDGAALIGAGYALGGVPVLGWGAALVAVLATYIRVQCRVAGLPMDYSGPMAKPMRMLVLCGAAVWTAVVPQSWYPGWGPDGEWGVMVPALMLIIAGGVITIIRRTYRAVNILQEGKS